MNRLLLVMLALGFLLVAGCASTSKGPHVGQRVGPDQLSPEAIDSMVRSFADDHVQRIIETTDRLARSNPASREPLNTVALKNAQSSYVIATGTNPIIGVVDFLVMIELQREAVRRAAIDPTLTSEERQLPESYERSDEAMASLLHEEHRELIRALSASDREIRRMAARVIFPEQMAELDRLIADWWAQNPSRRIVTHVRLQDFASYRGASVETLSSGPRNILGLLALDPLASMDPTTREIAQSRMLADRVTFQVQRLPMLLSLTLKDLAYDVLATEEVVGVLDAVDRTESVLDRMATVSEELPQRVADERSAALTQIDDLITAQRAASLEALEAAVARQREALLRSIEDASSDLDGTLASLHGTVEAANALSDSAGRTVEAFDRLTTNMAERAEDDPAPSEPVEFAEYQRLVETAAQGVADLERSIAALDRVLAPAAGGAPSRLDETVLAATEGTRDAVDHLYRRAVQLAAIVLAGALVVLVLARVIGAKLAPPR